MLRGTMSLPERLLWLRLRKREAGKPTFRRQHPVGPYILDFFCSEAQLCVAIDGYGHTLEDQAAHDARRTDYLRSVGIKVVRYAAKDVLADPDEVAHCIVVMAGEAQQAP